MCCLSRLFFNFYFIFEFHFTIISFLVCLIFTRSDFEFRENYGFSLKLCVSSFVIIICFMSHMNILGFLILDFFFQIKGFICERLLSVSLFNALDQQIRTSVCFLKYYLLDLNFMNFLNFYEFSSISMNVDQDPP